MAQHQRSEAGWRRGPWQCNRDADGSAYRSAPGTLAAGSHRCLPSRHISDRRNRIWLGPKSTRSGIGGGPRRATYFALEPSQSGRTCFSLLASLEPALTALSAAYDYSQPCYDDVPRGHAHALVFTSHSIEQVPELKREILTELFSLASELTVVHFEPVGWQIRAERGLEAARVGATKEYSEAKKYNRNLWELLVDLENSGG